MSTASVVLVDRTFSSTPEVFNKNKTRWYSGNVARNHTPKPDKIAKKLQIGCT